MNRFLNVEYNSIQTRIDTKGMVDLSEVQEKVLVAFKEITVGYARIQLWKKTATKDSQIKTWSQFQGLPEEYFEENGLFLNVQLLAPPPISRQPGSTELQTSSLLTSAVKRPLLFDQEMTLVKKRRGSISEKLVKTSGADFVYSDRTESFTILADCLEKRFLAWKGRKTDRNLHPIPFLADGPGSGKSRFLQELPSSFIKFVTQGTYSQEFKDIFQSPVCINITFGNGTPYSLKEANEIGIQQSVCLRILFQFETEYSNFGSFYDTFKSQGFSPSKVLDEVGMNASCIILGIDEVNKVYEIGKDVKKKVRAKHWDILVATGMQNDAAKLKELDDIKERLLSGLFELVGGLNCEFTPFFIPVLAGTAIGPMKSAVRESMRLPLHIPLPLLSFESCLNIFAMKDTKFSQIVRTSRELRQLISDCGGHCRSLEILYDSFSGAYVEDISLINWNAVINEVHVRLNDRYSISTIPLATAICRSLLGLDTRSLDSYSEMGLTSYQDLEERGLIKLRNGKVIIPYFFVCCFLSKNKLNLPLTKYWAKLLIGEGADFWWQDWEIFNCNYIAFRLSLYAYLGVTTIPLKKFFSGAKMNIPGDINIKIPQLEDLKVSKAERRYPPLTTTQLPPPAFDIGDNVLNTTGAPFDSFVYLNTTTNNTNGAWFDSFSYSERTTNGENDETTSKRVLFAFQMKLANTGSTTQQVISDDTVNHEFNKINNALRNTDFVCVMLGRCSGTFSEDKLPSKCVVVSKDEQMNFYGESFYQRLNLDVWPTTLVSNSTTS